MRQSISSTGSGREYYDVFPVGHGKHALVIADVPEKGSLPRFSWPFPGLRCGSSRAGNIRPARAYQINTIFIEASGSASFCQRVFVYPPDPQNPYCRMSMPAALSCYMRWDNGETVLSGPVVGLVDDPDYTEQEILLHQGDVLVMYTDGVTEAINRSEKMFGEGQIPGRNSGHGPGCLQQGCWRQSAMKLPGSVGTPPSLTILPSWC